MTVGILALQGGFASHGVMVTSLGATAREVRTPGDLEGCHGLIIPGGESTVLTRLLMEPGTGPGTGSPWQPGRLFTAIQDFAQHRPVMGTCAGLILLARPCGDARVYSLDLLPVVVERNAYGRQTESFMEDIVPDLGGNRGKETLTETRARDCSVKPTARLDPAGEDLQRKARPPAGRGPQSGQKTEDQPPYQGIFIRAPRIRDVAPGVEVLAWARGHGEAEPVMVRHGKILGLAFHPELCPHDTRIHRYFMDMTL